MGSTGKLRDGQLTWAELNAEVHSPYILLATYYWRPTVDFLLLTSYDLLPQARLVAEGERCDGVIAKSRQLQWELTQAHQREARERVDRTRAAAGPWYGRGLWYGLCT